VRAIENAFAAIIEVPAKKHEARDAEGDVGGGENDFRAMPASSGAQAFHENLGITQVLDHVEQEDLIEP
jgi:hypothetical protein